MSIDITFTQTLCWCLQMASYMQYILLYTLYNYVISISNKHDPVIKSSICESIEHVWLCRQLDMHSHDISMGVSDCQKSDSIKSYVALICWINNSNTNTIYHLICNYLFRLSIDCEYLQGCLDQNICIVKSGMLQWHSQVMDCISCIAESIMLALISWWWSYS